MALGIEAEQLVELLEPLPQDRHLFGGKLERLTGPQSGMNADRGDLVMVAAIADRHHDEVERDPAMDRRPQAGLGQERHLTAVVEIADGFVAAAIVGRVAGTAEEP